MISEKHVLMRRHSGATQAMIVTIHSPQKVDPSWKITDLLDNPEAVRLQLCIGKIVDRRSCFGRSKCQYHIQGDDSMSVRQVTITNLQKFGAHVQPIGNDGNPVPIDGDPIWQSDNDTIATVHGNGLDAMIFSTGVLGTCNIVIRADARFGPDVREIVSVIELTVIQDERTEAADLAITVDPPEDR